MFLVLPGKDHEHFYCGGLAFAEDGLLIRDYFISRICLWKIEKRQYSAYEPYYFLDGGRSFAYTDANISGMLFGHIRLTFPNMNKHIMSFLWGRVLRIKWAIWIFNYLVFMKFMAGT